MKLELLPYNFCVGKVKGFKNFDFTRYEFIFIAKTDKENSIIMRTKEKPDSIELYEDNFMAFRVFGQLDFSLIGIISKLSAILANDDISLIAQSTFDTDYIFVRESNLAYAIDAFMRHGIIIEDYKEK